MPKYKTIKVIYKKLTHGFWGYSEGGGTIHIDERARGKKKFELLIHEMLHDLFPQATEGEVEERAAIMTRTLWREGFRCIDNHDKEKLQDEKKPIRA